MGIPYSHISPEEGAKNKSLNHIREVYKKQWESEEDIPYADSIYKLIDNVIEHQVDKMSNMELEEFYRIYMQKHYADRRNAVEFNNAWMEYKDCECKSG